MISRRKLIVLACVAAAAGLGVALFAGGEGPAELTRAEAVAVELGTSRERVKERLGEPEREDSYSDCLTYVAEGIERKARGSRRTRRERDEGDDRARWQFCFDSRGKRLLSIALDGDLVR